MPSPSWSGKAATFQMSPGRPAFHLGAPVAGARQYTVSALVPTAMPKAAPPCISTASPLAPAATSFGGGADALALPAPGPTVPGGPCTLLPRKPNCQITLPNGPCGLPDRQYTVSFSL